MKTGRNIRNPPSSGPTDAGGVSVPATGPMERLRVLHLRLLVALAEERGIHRVARRLGMTQPAASKLLREIERAFGTPLFERNRRGVAPNSAGAAVVERARLMLGVLDGTQETLSAIAAGAVGTVRVGVLAVAAPVLLPKALDVLARRDGMHGSRLRVRLEEGSPESLLGSLRRGTLDCVVGRMVEDESSADLAIEYLYREPIVLVAGPDHPLVRRRKLGWPDTVGYPWILPPPGAPLRRALQDWFSKRNLPFPTCELESVSILANVTVARQSDTLVMLPGGVAEHYEALGLIRILPLEFESTRVSVATRRGEPCGPALSLLLDAIRVASTGMKGHLRRAV